MMPEVPKLYHIVHFDRLPSILNSQGLLCDAVMAAHDGLGTTIGMGSIKRRRLEELTLESHPGLYVGECVPFYFCPRSIMLYLLYQANHPELTYRGGQESIVHLQADLHATIEWATQQQRRWAFTLSNAGAYYFEDRADIAQLDEINWNAVQAHRWSGNGIARSIKEGKQAEFLVEQDFPWHLVERIGVRSRRMHQAVMDCLPANIHRPPVEIMRDWYY
ncbi:MAG: hypothetical protein CME81_08015 [Halomonas sp.]|nr:hypothetical protein CF98_07460 [Halopseudomonas bauzanensis]MAZ06331.1 hypothetical protein [Halomonas sp.]|tara:strand:+ start:1137 stop:1793 length:657 start_codon:yes stop_codon:yes gene_type:complete